MSHLSTAILEHLSHLPEGTSISAKGLLHLGSRAAVDQALSRLVKRGQLLRAGRGIYLLPIETRFGTRPPMPNQVVEALGATKGELIAPHGAAAANALGLTTQVPIQLVYLTSGRSRVLQLGSQTIELRHAPRWQLTTPGPAGEIIRALAWLGERQAPEALQLLRRRLPTHALEALAGARTQLPTWLALQVSQWIVNG